MHKSKLTLHYIIQFKSISVMLSPQITKICITRSKIKGDVHVHTTNTYRVSKGTALDILNLDTRSRCMLHFESTPAALLLGFKKKKTHWYPLNMRLSMFQSCYRCSQGEKGSCPCGNQTPDHPVHSLVTMLTTLFAVSYVFIQLHIRYRQWKLRTWKVQLSLCIILRVTVGHDI